MGGNEGTRVIDLDAQLFDGERRQPEASVEDADIIDLARWVEHANRVLTR